MWGLAIAVFFTAILAPGLRIALLLYLLLPLRLGYAPPGFTQVFRWDLGLVPWEMMDVFMLGILVAVVKLADMATIVPGTSLWAFVALIFLLAGAQAFLDPREIWQRVAPMDMSTDLASAPTAHCHVCGLVQPAQGHQSHCPRCGAALHRRKPASIQRTWALVIAAAILYVPANLLPIMSVTSLGKTQSDTILSGAQYLLLHGMWPLALVVFVASVLVPLMKLAILVFLLISVQFRSRWRLRDRTRLYRITEFIGRWSMVDIYVVTVLVALVRLGNLATIEAELGAVFFAAVVILTMFAAMTFDPRLIWDAAEPEDGRNA
jgi:paraquat-inducible protein A